MKQKPSFYAGKMNVWQKEGFRFIDANSTYHPATITSLYHKFFPSSSATVTFFLFLHHCVLVVKGTLPMRCAELSSLARGLTIPALAPNFLPCLRIYHVGGKLLPF